MRETDYRLLQVFLSPTARGIFEVSANALGKLHCTCPGYRVRLRCKHLEYVVERLIRNGGEYSLIVPAGLDADFCAEAMRDPDTFREFVLRYGSVEVL
jgi:hypothetical protein